jgi:colanic acid/amylovoran biosynthesis glycosyltransferase
MPVVAHGIYTYAHKFPPFVYNQLYYLEQYKPVVFTYGIGVHEVYYQFPVYAPNAMATKTGSDDARGFRRLSQAIGGILSLLGLRDFVLRVMQRRGKDFFLQAAKGEHVRLLHAHFGPSGVKFLPLCQRLGLPLVVSTYGYDITSLPLQNITYRQAIDDLFTNASLVLAMSRDMHARLIDLGCPQDKVVVHHTSVNVNDFAFDNIDRKNKEKLRILTVCNYVEKKGLPYLIKAFAQVQERFPQTELRIVGRPQESNKITNEVDRLIEELGLYAKVSQQASIPYREMPKEYAEADIFALPSVTAQDGNQEGVPTVLMEAQSSGLPTVSTWHAGIPEVVLDEETGFLVEERDIEALADRLAQLLASRELREQMGSRGRAYVEKEFNIHRQTKRLEQLYDQVLRGVQQRFND